MANHTTINIPNPLLSPVATIAMNKGEWVYHDGIFAIDKGITYKLNLFSITTANSDCARFKAKVKWIGCQSLIGMSGRGGQKSSKKR